MSSSVAQSRSHKRPNYGAAWEDASASSRTQKLGKSNSLRSHASHGSHGIQSGRGSDANTGSSLKIPNWRARQSDDSMGGGPSSFSTRSSLVLVEDGLTASASESASIPRVSSPIRADSAQGRANKGKHVSAFWTSSNAADRQPEAHRHRQARVYSRGSSSSSAFSFEVLRHSSLVDGDNGQTVSLFELSSSSHDSSDSSKGKEKCILTPASSEDYSSDDAFAQMLSRKHTVTPDDSQREQLLAALCASEATPGRSPDSSMSSFVDTLQRLSIKAGPAVSSTDSATVREAAVAPSSRTYQNASSSSRTATTTIQPATSRSHLVGGQVEDDRFNKMLNKLHRNVGQKEQKPVQEGLNTDRQQQQCAYDATSASTVQHRRPIHGIGRRVNTESDFMIEYMPASAGPSRADYPADFGTTGGSSGSYIGGGGGGGAGHHDKCNTLNPKAREFLSFSKADSQTAFMARRPTLGSCVLPTVQDGNEDGTLLQDTSNTTMPAPCPTYFQASAVLSHCPVSGTNPAPLNLVPITLETYNPSGAVINDGNTKSVPPLVPSVPCISGVPCLPVSCGTGSLPVPPRPVPKPTIPDTKTQQEYEEWVEWRKTYEPGYAMACKVRQQRRAQRKTAQQQKSGRANKST
ncbi:hypothetical protein E4U55_007634 [Claviceps digitariae]|nr:hypothetical protein E4U55_007634 [Claviceps digitariae]